MIIACEVFACHCSHSVFNSTPSSLFFFFGLSKSFSSPIANCSRECSKACKRITFSASLSFSAGFGRRFGSLLCEFSGFWKIALGHP
ncbi:hypothetical protein AAC387_Pa01g0373 [Persea americana]